MGPGDIIGDKYEILRLVGQGGMGVVYEGRHRLLGRRVAVKLVHRELTHDAEVVARFHREAHAATAIGSEHIVDVLDVGLTSDGVPYLVMEFLEGEDLLALLQRRGPLEPAETLLFVLQACQALAAAHARGIVHRDIKPANLFLTIWDDGTPWIKILDFGIAKFRDALAAENPGLTVTGTAVGTPYYMSPEQAQGENDVDHRTDVYAVGVVLYELLTGHKPFVADCVNKLIVLLSTTQPLPPRQRRPDLSPQLEAIILRAMAPRREDRFQTIVELADALAQPSRYRSVPPLSRLEEGRERETTPAPTAFSSPLTTRRPWSSPLRTFGLLGLVLALMTGGGLFVARGLDRSRTESGSVNENPEPLAQSALGTSSPPVSRDWQLPPSATAESLPADIQLPQRSARIEISVTPAEAQLQVDGILVSSNPFVGRFPANNIQHRIQASAPGHRSHAQFVHFDQDRTLEIQLEPLPAPDRGRAHAKSASSPAPAPRERQPHKAALTDEEELPQPLLQRRNPYAGDSDS